MSMMRSFLVLFTLLLAACKSDPVQTLPQEITILQFDGVDDYLQAPDHPSLDVGRGDFTWEAWIKPNRTGVRKEIISKKDLNADSEHDLVLFLDRDDRAYVFLRETLHGTPALYLPSQSQIGSEWTHLAAVRAGGLVTLYVNGVAEASSQNTYDVSSNGPLRIGANHSNNAGANAPALFNFSGAIREVRIWNIARTAAQIRSGMSGRVAERTSGLVGYYRLDDGSGNGARDVSRIANHATLVNGPVWMKVALP